MTQNRLGKGLKCLKWNVRVGIISPQKGGKGGEQDASAQTLRGAFVSLFTLL